MARRAAQLKGAGLTTRTTASDGTPSVPRRAHAIWAWRRRGVDDAKEAKAITGERATIATLGIADDRELSVNARRWLPPGPLGGGVPDGSMRV